MAGTFVEMSKARQSWECAGGAIATGAICGVLATTVTWAYLLAVVLTVVGGLGAGTQHRTLRGAAVRGFVAGALWAVTAIIAIEVTGRHPVAAVPRPLGVLVVYAVVATVLVTIGVWRLSRSRRRTTARQRR